MSVESDYVYIFVENRKPIYVGRGTGARILSHLKEKEWAKGRRLTCKIYPTDRAIQLEAALIQKYQETLENKYIPKIDLGGISETALYKEIIQELKTKGMSDRHLRRVRAKLKEQGCLPRASMPSSPFEYDLNIKTVYGDTPPKKPLLFRDTLMGKLFVAQNLSPEIWNLEVSDGV